MSIWFENADLLEGDTRAAALHAHRHDNENDWR